MSNTYVMGLDVGTTSVKACIFNSQGNLLTVSEQMITSNYPQKDWVEQDPVAIERSAVLAMKEAVQHIDLEQGVLSAVGISAAMHSLICIDETGLPCSPALIWADGRGVVQAERLQDQMGKEIYARTGIPVHPMTPFVKLLWMKETGYIPYRQARYYMSIKEYLIFCWFNKRLIDHSMASATGLFDLNTYSWDQELMHLTGVLADQLSEVVPITTSLTGLEPSVAAEIGIDPELPFVIGASDGPLSNLGIGAILPGEVAVSVGTSGAIRQITQGIRLSRNQETFCYAFTEDSSIIGGPTNNGGIVIQWLKELLRDEGSFEDFLARAERIPPGAEGIVFLPYINGERAPLWNQRARGNFYGLSITHSQDHWIRAVLEGITFNLYHIGQALAKLAGKPSRIFVNGGLARSPLFLQMMADIFETHIYVSESHHSAAWGAAWTALTAIGRVSNLEDIRTNIPMCDPIVPDPQQSEQYKKVFQKYVQLVEGLSPHF